ncbi:MAG: DUF4276 family protein [Bacteroidota bacterium]
MIRVNIICEGSTEEQFVHKLLAPHFLSKGIIVVTRNLGKGDSYDKLRYNIVQWMKEDKSAFLTTLIDLYGMNRRFPGYDENKHKPPLDKVIAIEAAVKDDLAKEGLDTRQFIPHFQLHEFEALLFSSPDDLHAWLSIDRPIRKGVFQAIRDDFETPEHINDDPNTAPSKRILKAVPSYSKVAEGVLIAEEIGLEKMRAACLHFNAWMTQLESLAP